MVHPDLKITMWKNPPRIDHYPALLPLVRDTTSEDVAPDCVIIPDITTPGLMTVEPLPNMAFKFDEDELE